MADRSHQLRTTEGVLDTRVEDDDVKKSKSKSKLRSSDMHIGKIDRSAAAGLCVRKKREKIARRPARDVVRCANRRRSTGGQM